MSGISEEFYSGFSLQFFVDSLLCNKAACRQKFNRRNKVKKILVFIFSGLASYGQAFPLNEIYTSFDIKSFDSSLMQKMSEDQRYLPQIDLPKPNISNESILIESDYWKYEFKFFKETESGIHICFIDKAKWGSYDTQTPMIIRKYGDKYVAIKAVTDVCEDFEK